jgi:hypothetical protein
MKYAVPVVILLVASATAVASTFGWPGTKRPPIALDQALAQVAEHIGDRSKGCYCVAAYILGNKEQDGKAGAWNLAYRSEKGDRFNVTIHMDGTIRVYE